MKAKPEISVTALADGHRNGGLCTDPQAKTSRHIRAINRVKAGIFV